MLRERSSGVIPFRRVADRIEFLLLHSAMVRNPDATWEFPKGSIEEGETELEAALRELGEEACLHTITILPDFKDQVRYQYRRDGREIQKSVTFFVGEIMDWSPVPPKPPTPEHRPHPSEGRWYVWVNENEALRRLFHPGMRKLLRRATAFLYEYDRIQAAARPRVTP